MDDIEALRGLLQHRKRWDLAALLAGATISFDESDQYGSYLFSRLTTAEIGAPPNKYDQLRALSPDDHQRILEALLELFPPRDREMEICRLVFRIDAAQLADPETETKELIADIEAQRNLMVAVATGGPRISSVNAEYQERRDRLESALSVRGLSDPNPHSDLWEWYGKWSSGDLPSYQSRRNYIGDLYKPLLDRLRAAPSVQGASVFAEPTGWARVDRTLIEIRRRLAEATAEEQYQVVGTLCREALITLAQTVYSADRHPILDGTVSSNTDAKRMLEAYLAAELGGQNHETARRHAKAALDLANELQHRRTADFRQAALCAEATTAVVNLIAIISGQRDPQ